MTDIACANLQQWFYWQSLIGFFVIIVMFLWILSERATVRELRRHNEAMQKRIGQMPEAAFEP